MPASPYRTLPEPSPNPNPNPPPNPTPMPPDPDPGTLLPSTLLASTLYPPCHALPSYPPSLLAEPAALCGSVHAMKTFTTHLATALLSAGVALTGAAALRGEFSTTDRDYVVTTSGIIIYEDDPRWDCRVMGNRVCGPTNVQGVPAGDYSRLRLAGN